MSLYKQQKDVKYSVDIAEQENGELSFLFTADCGKYGTDEMIDGYILTPDRLLEILQDRNDFTDDEL